jgi:SAM-dependent methyltransferase
MRMVLSRLHCRDVFLESVRPVHEGELHSLHERMKDFYFGPHYHAEWIRGVNANWREGVHDAQIAMCRRIPFDARVLEVGCGDGSCALEIMSRAPAAARYTGLDLNPAAWRDSTGFEFVRGSADEIPFPSESFDAVISMFVIEHLAFPARFLDEAWRVLAHGARFLLIAPDFLSNAMASERVGFSYGAGRRKLRSGRVLDALMSAFDVRVRIPLSRARRRRLLARGQYSFPVLLNPLCLCRAGFVPDCDAVYPACPEEIVNYLRAKPDCGACEVFYRDRYTFGLSVTKSGIADR